MNITINKVNLNNVINKQYTNKKENLSEQNQVENKLISSGYSSITRSNSLAGLTFKAKKYKIMQNALTKVEEKKVISIMSNLDKIFAEAKDKKIILSINDNNVVNREGIQKFVEDRIRNPHKISDVYYSGVPGSGNTFLVRSLSKTFGIPYIKGRNFLRDLSSTFKKHHCDINEMFKKENVNIYKRESYDLGSMYRSIDALTLGQSVSIPQFSKKTWKPMKNKICLDAPKSGGVLLVDTNYPKGKGLRIFTACNDNAAKNKWYESAQINNYNPSTSKLLYNQSTNAVSENIFLEDYHIIMNASVPLGDRIKFMTQVFDAIGALDW